MEVNLFPAGGSDTETPVGRKLRRAVRRQGGEFFHEMVGKIAFFGLTEAGDAEVLLAVDVFEAGQAVAGEPVGDQLAEPRDIRHGLFKVPDRGARPQGFGDGKGPQHAVHPDGAAD